MVSCVTLGVYWLGEGLLRDNMWAFLLPGGRCRYIVWACWRGVVDFRGLRGIFFNKTAGNHVAMGFYSEFMEYLLERRMTSGEPTKDRLEKGCS